MALIKLTFFIVVVNSDQALWIGLQETLKRRHFVSWRPNSVLIICDTAVEFYQKFQCVGTEGLHLGKE